MEKFVGLIWVKLSGMLFKINCKLTIEEHIIFIEEQDDAKYWSKF